MTLGLRKLACSKHPDGCERCKRENIQCVYSEQKQMGRPRKRQFVESAREEAIDQNSNITNHEGPPFVDTFGLYNDTVTQQSFSSGEAAFSTLAEPPKLPDQSIYQFQFGDRHLAGPPIDFGDLNLGVLASLDPSLDLLPSLSTESNTSASESEHSPPQVPLTQCSCLASMYLALSSLQQFPTDVVSALKTVRSAAGTAAGSIWCSNCGAVLGEHGTPSIEVFQNIMLLGTILPTIADGYQRLLKMVDDETEAAAAAGQTKTFRFQEYGGLSEHQQDLQMAMSCAEQQVFINNVEMPPQQWRATVRALLRIDIYGHETPGFKHKGLKDLVEDLENRQKTRHELVGIQPSGLMGSAEQCENAKSHTTHGCLQIVHWYVYVAHEFTFS